MGEKVEVCKSDVWFMGTWTAERDAERCAARLEEETGRDFEVNCGYINTSGGFPPEVYQAYCRVIEGKK